MKCTGESICTVLSPFFPLSAFSWSSQPLLLGLHRVERAARAAARGRPKGKLFSTVLRLCTLCCLQGGVSSRSRISCT